MIEFLKFDVFGILLHSRYSRYLLNERVDQITGSVYYIINTLP